MLFHIKWMFSPEVRNDAYDQFLETGGLPPEGVKMIGRWHDVAALEGYIIAETDNVSLIGKWLTEWNDKLIFETVPVILDEEAAEVVRAARGK